VIVILFSENELQLKKIKYIIILQLGENVKMAKKYVYSFEEGKAEMKNLLGGKEITILFLKALWIK